MLYSNGTVKYSIKAVARTFGTFLYFTDGYLELFYLQDSVVSYGMIPNKENSTKKFLWTVKLRQIPQT